MRMKEIFVNVNENVKVGVGRGGSGWIKGKAGSGREKVFVNVNVLRECKSQLYRLSSRSRGAFTKGLSSNSYLLPKAARLSA